MRGIMSQLDELRQKRSLILDIAAKHGAFNVRAFGSVDILADRTISALIRLQVLAEAKPLLEMMTMTRSDLDQYSDK